MSTTSKVLTSRPLLLTLMVVVGLGPLQFIWNLPKIASEGLAFVGPLDAITSVVLAMVVGSLWGMVSRIAETD